MRDSIRGQSKSFEQKRRRRFLLSVVGIGLGLSGVIYTFSGASFAKVFNIHTVEVSGVDPQVAAIMEAAAYRAIQGSYLGLFSRSNAMIYSETRIIKEIASASPSISAIEVKRRGLHTITVDVSEKSGDALICAELPDLGEGEIAESAKCYVADNSGFIYKRLSQSDPISYNRFYFPELEGTDPVGKYATSSETFRELQEFVKRLKATGITVESTLVKSAGDYELYARNPSADSIVVVYFSDKADLETQRENLIAFWQKMVSDAKAKKKTIEWSDIKLQYPPNVYYTEAQ